MRFDIRINVWADVKRSMRELFCIHTWASEISGPGVILKKCMKCGKHKFVEYDPLRSDVAN